MDIRIYDVEHGDCCLVLSSKNEAVLVDCGINKTTRWKPSEGLARQGFGSRRRLHHLILTHPDQDHLSDLEGVLEKLKPQHVWQHPQLSVRTLADYKDTLSRAQEAFSKREKTAKDLHPMTASSQFRSMELRQFYLPVGSVKDLNDLSLVSFITEDGFTVCFPGDLKGRGWRLHLKNKAFQYMLRETNLFLASHHGRPSGYVEQAYEYLSPKLIVISDRDLMRGQKVIKLAPYSKHARGTKLEDGSFRRVLTTSQDGRIRIVVKDGVWQVSTSSTGVK